MTTAHRPTWAAAKGSKMQGGARGFGQSTAVSVKEIYFGKMKTREEGQADQETLAKRDLKAELLRKEEEHDRQRRIAASGGALDAAEEDAALLAELERIKAERAEEAARAEAEAKAEEEAAKGAMFSAGNPLLAGAGGGGVKRRWDDDVVFRNQAREEPKKRTGFINDTIRNDFHKRFISRYIR
eukprot:PRCOL_00003569-RA